MVACLPACRWTIDYVCRCKRLLQFAGKGRRNRVLAGYNGFPGVPGTQYFRGSGGSGDTIFNSTHEHEFEAFPSPNPFLRRGDRIFFDLPYGATSWIDFDICIRLARWLVRKCQNLKIY